ncbi:hypothetical protein PHLGIDRAFT_209349 [Phlebiopsis gigantea 11061_1 CR5-6]|uniref:Uncharacterized protein n=1 Tax=Phlebiopsis gigantea (strain 11061_1 CR5-6) TaxID=745531 RepID=A0A0C3S4I3_PHLG1|nr:hypothetical protein PHLGIDRAFT_209349 [Phlebiopsis gigantea 11061_1 CR5-6]
MKLEIDWDAPKDFRSDGTKRTKASTIHGWVTKWRGTFSGNERTRSEGIREMRTAQAIRQWKRKHRASSHTRGQHGGGLFSLSFLAPGSHSRSSSSKKGSKRHGSSRAVVRREASGRGKGNELVLHVSSHSRSPRRGNSTSKVEGRITHRTTSPKGRSRPTLDRRATTTVERSTKSRPSQPTRRRTEPSNAVRRR